MTLPLYPKKIPSNGRLGAFTPSDPITASRRLRIERGVQILRSSKLEVTFSGHAFDSAGHVSSSVENRIKDIHELSIDPSVDALIATCGGKCSNALLMGLDYDLLARARKPIMGFSDVGVLLNAITAKTGMLTFYGPNVLSKLDETQHHSLVELRQQHYESTWRTNRDATIVDGVFEGRLIGGNLSTFTVSIAGTQYEPRYHDVVLFWESGSHDWRLIDQYFGALILRGIFDRIGGMIIGRLGDADDVTFREDEFLRHRLAEFGIPVLRTTIFGHGRAENPIWPVGGLVRLNATERTITLLEPLVSED